MGEGRIISPDCESSWLPSLERAALVHSNVHNGKHDHVVDQTGTVTVCVSLLVVVYVVVIVWLVSRQLKSLSSLDEEQLLVVKDKKGDTKLLSPKQILDDKTSV